MLRALEDTNYQFFHSIVGAGVSIAPGILTNCGWQLNAAPQLIVPHDCTQKRRSNWNQNFEIRIRIIINMLEPIP